MAERAHIDADVLIRLLTGDDAEKQARCAELLRRAAAGEVDLVVGVTTVFDTFFVLTSRTLYGGSREDAAATLTTLLLSPGVNVENRRLILRALQLVPRARSLGDAMIAAEMEADSVRTLYSFDRGFERFPWIDRREP